MASWYLEHLLRADHRLTAIHEMLDGSVGTHQVGLEGLHEEGELIAQALVLDHCATRPWLRTAAPRTSGQPAQPAAQSAWTTATAALPDTLDDRCD